MTAYFYCAKHHHASGVEYQNGIIQSNCPPTNPLFLDRVKSDIAATFDVPCSSGQVILLSLSVLSS